MRILFVLQHPNFFRALDPVVRLLHSRGHEMTVLHRGGAVKRDSALKSGRGLEMCRQELHGLDVAVRPLPSGRWHRVMAIGRMVVNRSLFLRPEHPCGWRGPALDRSLPVWIQTMLRRALVRRLLGTKTTLRLWRWLELLNPPSPAVVEQISAQRPDVVVVSPTIWPKDPTESEFIHAARGLGIPTAGFVSSWDNLTSKGTIHVLPDVLMVWNEALAHEAITLHLVPADVIRIVGAPYLDHFFSMRPTETRADVNRRIGLPDDGPFALYFCTSPTLIRSEVEIVSALADALAARRHVRLVVRPHPTNANYWEEYHDPRVLVFPRGGDLVDYAEAWQEYFNLLASASATIGLNTTAHLEAAVAGRPCLTLVDERYRMAQTATGHFHHLMDGGLLDAAYSIDELADRISRLAAGHDDGVERRRRFVTSFLRPNGLDIPAADVVTSVIERLGTPAPGGEPLAVPPLLLDDPLPGQVLRA